MKVTLLRAATKLLCLVAVVSMGLEVGDRTAQAQAARNPAAGNAADEMPVFRYDPDWPKTLPNGWTTGVIGGIYIGKDDHVWVATRPETVTAISENYLLEGLADCCTPAPPVIEFDPKGNVVQGWGAIHAAARSNARPLGKGADPGLYTGPVKQVLVGKQPGPGPYPVAEWPSSEHMMYVDYKGNVWISSQSPPSQILKFTHDGRFIKRFGTKEAKSSSDTANFAGPTGIYVDPKTNEAFVSDGYRNRRVIVFDADTGAFKRMWGAYGKPPKDPQQLDAFGSDRTADQFSVTHCIRPDNDGLLYVCDRANDRIQVFRKDGTFVRQLVVGKRARPGDKIHLGAAWDVAFSPDKQQKFMYVSDGTNKKIWIVRRSDFKILGSFGHGGRQGGQFETNHVLGADSHGNLYVGETLGGNRIQRFLFAGMGPAAASK